MTDAVRHPIITDTDALIATANTALWETIVSTLQLTTTNVCIQELHHHIRTNSPYAAPGTHEHWIHSGSEAAIQPFEEQGLDAFSIVPAVPRPHGADAGEQSIKNEIGQHPGDYRVAVLMDGDGRHAINSVFQEQDHDGKAVAPTYLLYLLLDANACTEREFCLACGELLRGEGWTGYKAIQAAWEAIPVNCSQYLDTDLLP